MLRDQGKGTTGSEILHCPVSHRVALSPAIWVETVFLPSDNVIHHLGLEKMSKVQWRTDPKMVWPSRVCMKPLKAAT